MYTQAIGNTKRPLLVLLAAWLLAASAALTPVVLEQVTGLSVTAAAHACGGQSGGC